MEYFILNGTVLLIITPLNDNPPGQKFGANKYIAMIFFNGQNTANPQNFLCHVCHLADSFFV